jgi:hypothetical protein
VTQLITEVILRRAKFVVLALAVLAVVQTVLLMSMAFGVLPRLQERQDELAARQDKFEVVQTASAGSAQQARDAAEETERVLREAIAAFATPSPTALHTRAQLDALCEQLLGSGCPEPPTTVPATTTSTIAEGE